MLEEPCAAGSSPASSPNTGGIAQLVERRQIFIECVLLKCFTSKLVLFEIRAVSSRLRGKSPRGAPWQMV